MNDLAVARALHVAAILIWIGGVAMVTTVLLPAIRRLKGAAERQAFFEAVERRFAWQAQATRLPAGHTASTWCDPCQMTSPPGHDRAGRDQQAIRTTSGARAAGLAIRGATLALLTLGIGGRWCRAFKPISDIHKANDALPEDSN